MKYLLIILFVKTITAENTSDSNCGVIPTPQWAGEASHRNENLTNPVSLAILSHTATRECSTDPDCEDLLKIMRNYFIDHMGFTDMAHSFYVGGNGKVYEGAGWHHVGAHTRTYNNRSIGITFIGDFREKKPTYEALQATHDLLACGMNKEYLSKDYHLVGHRQLSQTESPGTALHAHIQTWPHWTDDIHSL